MLALDAILSTALVNITPHCGVATLIDNMTLISQIQTWHYQEPMGSLAPEYDILQVAWGIMAKHRMIVTPDHIRSRQGSDAHYSKLLWKAKLNCDCDHLSGSTWQSPECRPMHAAPYLIPPVPIASWQINGNFITSHTATAIREASFCSELIQHITNKSPWQSTTIFDTTDWESCSRASLSLPQGKCLTIFKLEFDLFATMSQCHKMEKHTDHQYPRYSKFHENLNHVFQCPKLQAHLNQPRHSSYLPSRRHPPAC